MNRISNMHIKLNFKIRLMYYWLDQREFAEKKGFLKVDKSCQNHENLRLLKVLFCLHWKIQ